jgi:N-acyl-D-aspartate/D-glutamate deacylase
LGVNNRGTLKIGNAADVVVFDPLSINDKADYSNPYQYPQGLDAVLVNGKLALQNNKVQSLSGEVIAR